MILTKMIINVSTGEVENIPLTDEEIAAHEVAAQKAADEAAPE
jgi:hypothetical protein